MALPAKVGMGAGAAIGASVLFVPGADAATFTVTNLNDGGAGSLRDALNSANSNFPEDDTIVFQSGLSGTITLTTGELAIFEGGSVDIQGPGSGALAISGQDLYQIFHIYNGIGDSVSISGLTLRDGFAGAEGGGALYLGPNPHDAVALADVVITSSYAIGNGGGIRNEGAALSITNSSITGNESASEGGGVYGDGGTLSVAGATFSGNTADDPGGAVHIEDTDAGPNAIVIRDSAFSGNLSASDGGGIHFDDPDGATLIARTTISGNRATPLISGYGGGLNVGYLGEGDDITIANSTISGNFARFGGGIYFAGLGSELTVANSTISGNDASYAGGAAWLELNDTGAASLRNSTVASNVSGYYGAGIFFDNDNAEPGAPIALSSTIVADNADTHADSDFAPDLDQDPAAPGFTVGFSLIEDATGADSAAVISEDPAGSNLLGVDPALGALADNGGPTQTHLPALASPALEAGTSNGLGTDQRGFARTFDAANIVNRAGSDATDIGAVERVAEGTCKGMPATILFEPGQPVTGTEGDDVIVGTDAAETINALGGNDRVCAGGGNDKLSGGAGKDALEGEAGNDSAGGGAGKDAVNGGAGKDRLKGNGGKDKLKGQAGKDTLKGGAGKDKLKGGAGKDKLVGGPGKDKLNGGGGKDREVQ